MGGEKIQENGELRCKGRGDIGRARGYEKESEGEREAEQALVAVSFPS